MKALMISLIFFSQLSMAARILEAGWDAGSRSVVVRLVYHGGCLPHVFSIDWQDCELDPIDNSVVRFGQILDSGWQDTCSGAEHNQTIVIQEPQDGCYSNTLILKSTSSKTHVRVRK